VALKFRVSFGIVSNMFEIVSKQLPTGHGLAYIGRVLGASMLALKRSVLHEMIKGTGARGRG